MTIQTLITKVNEEKPNTFSESKMIEFVNEIEADVSEELKIEPPVYTTTANTLLVPEPYSKLYVSYIKAMVDYANEEYGSYQLNAEQHAIDFSEFRNWVVRTKQAKNNPRRFSNVM